MPNDEMCFALMLTALRDQIVKDTGVTKATAAAAIAMKMMAEPEKVIRKIADLIDDYDERQMAANLPELFAGLGFTVIVLE